MLPPSQMALFDLYVVETSPVDEDFWEECTVNLGACPHVYHFFSVVSPSKKFQKLFEQEIDVVFEVFLVILKT